MCHFSIIQRDDLTYSLQRCRNFKSKAEGMTFNYYVCLRIVRLILPVCRNETKRRPQKLQQEDQIQIRNTSFWSGLLRSDRGLRLLSFRTWWWEYRFVHIIDAVAFLA
jgi:hypothetical protein